MKTAIENVIILRHTLRNSWLESWRVSFWEGRDAILVWREWPGIRGKRKDQDSFRFQRTLQNQTLNMFTSIFVPLFNFSLCCERTENIIECILKIYINLVPEAWEPKCDKYRGWSKWAAFKHNCPFPAMFVIWFENTRGALEVTTVDKEYHPVHPFQFSPVLLFAAKPQKLFSCMCL